MRGKVYPSIGEEQSARTIVPDLAERKNALAIEPGSKCGEWTLPRDHGHERETPLPGREPEVIHSNPQAKSRLASAIHERDRNSLVNSWEQKGIIEAKR